jgi:putative transposase
LYRVRLTDEQKQELQRRTREKTLTPKLRDRLEMVRLSDAGWSVPRIAEHFQLTQSRARHWIKAFLNEGFDALSGKKHPGPKPKLTPEVMERLKNKVTEEQRTWSSGQAAAWLAQEKGISVTTSHLCRVMNQSGLSYKRTTRTLSHKQKPEQVAAKQADLETLKRGHTPD